MSTSSVIPFSLRATNMLRGDELEPSRGSLTDSFILILLCGAFYGATMGTSGGDTIFGRKLQVFYSATKVPLLLLVTFAVSLPSFFVINTLAGAREEFGRVMNALVGAQAVTAMVLASLAPITFTFYLSNKNHEANIAFNGLMFAIAAGAGQFALRRSYRALIEKRPVHARLLRAWIAVYVFVAIQLAYVLRPFIGFPGRPTQFFREDSWDNAYVWVARMLWRLIAR